MRTVLVDAGPLVALLDRGKYRDLPMDMADAALVRVAEREGIRRVLTLPLCEQDRHPSQVAHVLRKHLHGDT